MRQVILPPVRGNRADATLQKDYNFKLDKALVMIFNLDVANVWCYNRTNLNIWR